MLGTAALPHILMRSYTTPSVKEARESVAWSLLFIGVLYVTAPALAVLVKFEVFNGLVGLPVDRLPAWIANWSRVDASLVSVTDINLDGILQLSEIRLGSDLVVLATPEIAGLPYVVSGMVAAGGLAAALSTADGLLLTISNALSHDLYFKMIGHNASGSRRVTISKVLLLVAALAAAAVATQKPADILFLVTAAFSIAASAFFPGACARHLLEPCQPRRCGGRHADGPGDHAVLPGAQRALVARGVRRLANPPSSGSASCRSRPACSACRPGFAGVCAGEPADAGALGRAARVRAPPALPERLGRAVAPEREPGIRRVGL